MTPTLTPGAASAGPTSSAAVATHDDRRCEEPAHWRATLAARASESQPLQSILTSSGQGRLSATDHTSWETSQLTSQITIVAPTYVQNPSIEKSGTTHSVNSSIATLTKK